MVKKILSLLIASWGLQAQADCLIQPDNALVCDNIIIHQIQKVDSQEMSLSFDDGFTVELVEAYVTSGPNRVFTYDTGTRADAQFSMNDRLAIQKAIHWLNQNDEMDSYSLLKTYELLPTNEILAPITLFSGEVPWPAGKRCTGSSSSCPKNR
ncbi:MAG: hypothetical protein AAF203_00295 [Pseudomonadota bacterium]